ncbi:hypothetical protein [Campylobacter concisus]|uniref:hypothetical protein n=1 Tax=Campylobacter concisus TaxID=199 RepID=UPI0021561EA3|nr:hypothetical protein [Campylobacter concisus]
MWLSLKSPKSSPATPFKTAASLLFLSATLLPSLLLVVSKSAKSPLMSCSDSNPAAEPSILLKI